MSPAFTARSTTKAKSRVTGWNGESSSAGLARVGLAPSAPGCARGSPRTPTSGPSASSASSARGCNSPKWPSTFCGPSWIVPERPGWNQAGPPGTICSACAGAPAAVEHARARRPWRRTRRPAPALPDQCRPAPVALAAPRRTPVAAVNWSSGWSPREDLPDLEQRRRRRSRGRRSSAPRRRGPGSRLGRMSDRSAAIGLASASSGLPPPNSSACGLRDERPGHGLDQAARRERALGLARAHLQRRSAPACAAPRRGRAASTARGRRRRCARPPRRGRPCPRRPAARTAARPSTRRPGPATKKPSCVEDALASRQTARSRPARRFTSASGKSMTRSGASGACRRRRSPTACRRRGRAPCCVASSRPGTMKAGSTPRSKR